MSAKDNSVIERDAAIRIIKYLQNKPYIEVAQFIEQLRNLNVNRETMANILNYLLKDENVWAFAYLYKLFNTPIEEEPAEKDPVKQEPTDESSKSEEGDRVVELPDNIK